VGERGRPRHVSPGLVAEAATELFLEQGYHHTSIDDIARRSGISRATFFNYFPAKADVLFHEVDRLLDGIDNRIARGTAPLVAILDTAADVARGDLPLIATHADAMDVVTDMRRVGPARVERLRLLVASQFPDHFGNWVVTGAIVAAVFSWVTEPSEGALADHISRALSRLEAVWQGGSSSMH